MANNSVKNTNEEICGMNNQYENEEMLSELEGYEDDFVDFDDELEEFFDDESEDDFEDDEEWEDWPDYVFEDVRYVSYDNRSNIDYDRMTDNELENYLMFGEMPD